MNDDLSDLKAMMDDATPRPDAARRAENLALAQKNFDALQGSRTQPRPTSATEAKGLWTGVKTMLTTFTSKPALTTTTAIVAVGFLYLSPQIMDSGVRNFGDFTGDQLLSESPQTTNDVPVEIAPVTASEPAPTAPVAPSVLAEQVDDSAKAAPAIAEMLSSNSGRARLENSTDLQPRDLSRALDDTGIEAGTVVSPNRMSQADISANPAPNTETFPTEAPNTLKVTAEEPVSTFSIDVDTASYAFVRSSLARGQMPPANAVRIEEMINYFPYDYAAPDADDAPFRPTINTFQTPWNPDTRIVHIGLQGEMPSDAMRPPLNLVFLIDTSGSMDAAAKLPLLKQSFRLMLDQLRPEDEVAIVTYAGSAGQVLAPTKARERSTILAALDQLRAGGGTNGQGGLQQAYATADGMAEDGEVSRIILATDGDFNVGLSDPEALKDYIADKRETGTYLSVLGFGRGNLDDATMQALAQNGNGIAAYIDTLSEAQKVLVDQVSGALFPIAGDVKVQVEFNPAQIAEYRLIGYETRALRREDFNNDRVDAGELGAGHAVTALYEVTPVGSPAQLSDPLRYGAGTVAAGSDEIGFLKLRYKEPGADTSELIETPIIGESVPGTEANFATAIAGFGQLLQGGQYLGDWGYDEAIALANASRGDDPFGYRTEAVQLMRLAQSLAR
ncbi:von Willebrand factor type A domain-containing protein [Yoonia sp. SS1-5]|uniref:von Willebrand factor type A domain-containing protein n=1 Tax=Yoonia rhodophyticola TaxID=3137370 RepID=A0AAN0MD30_9RHOB